MLLLTLGTATVACDPGETPVSGGFDSGGAASANNIFLEGYSFNLGAWEVTEVTIFNDDDTNMAQLFATVVCISPFPLFFV